MALPSGTIVINGITVKIIPIGFNSFITPGETRDLEMYISNSSGSGYRVLSDGKTEYSGGGFLSQNGLGNGPLDPGFALPTFTRSLTFSGMLDGAITCKLCVVLVLQNISTSAITVVEFAPTTLLALPVNSTTSNTPAITEFSARRCDVGGNLSDEGQYVRNIIRGNIAPGMGWTAAQHTLRVGYRVQGSGDPYTWTNKTGFPASVDIDEKLDTGAVFAAGSVYEIRCELINNQRSVTAHATSILPKAFANIHLSGSGHGVGIGQYSTATEEHPKFECQYPAHFFSGAFGPDGNPLGIDIYSTDPIVVGKWIDGKPIYAKTIAYTASATGERDVAHGVSGWDNIWIDLSASFFEASAYFYPLGYINSSGTRMFYATARRDSDNVFIGNNGAGTCYIRILYTMAD